MPATNLPDLRCLESCPGTRHDWTDADGDQRQCPGSPVGTPAPESTKQGRRPLYLVPFMNGERGPVLLTVTYFSDFLRGPDGTCAYCHGDPCAERSGPETLIGDWFARYSAWAETCPCCGGRAT